jgi:hypothetical protein
MFINSISKINIDFSLEHDMIIKIYLLINLLIFLFSVKNNMNVIVLIIQTILIVGGVTVIDCMIIGNCYFSVWVIIFTIILSNSIFIIFFKSLFPETNKKIQIFKKDFEDIETNLNNNVIYKKLVAQQHNVNSFKNNNLYKRYI